MLNAVSDSATGCDHGESRFDGGRLQRPHQCGSPVRSFNAGEHFIQQMRELEAQAAGIEKTIQEKLQERGKFSLE
jgi:hypothetical protein